MLCCTIVDEQSITKYAHIHIEKKRYTQLRHKINKHNKKMKIKNEIRHINLKLLKKKIIAYIRNNDNPKIDELKILKKALQEKLRIMKNPKL